MSIDPPPTPTVEAPETPDVVIGNHHHKYTSTNPAIRFLTERFLGALTEAVDAVGATTGGGSVLEIGCGEGDIVRRLEAFTPVVGLDLPDAGLRQHWRSVTGAQFVHGSAEQLPFPDDSFDVGVAVEVFEHLRDPEKGLQELVRVCRSHLILSVPREPIFRLGNFLAGRHVRSFGNTPGHLNHWSTRAFSAFVAQRATVERVMTPFPWTIVSARLAERTETS